VSLSSLGAEAVTYAGGWGWHVLPLSAGTKDRPATRHGFKDATADTAEVVDLWTRMPNANVGIATGKVSGLVVIDVDPPHGPETIRTLAASIGALPTTLVALTPRGAHAYFNYPSVEVRSSAGRLGPGVDVRAEGGYIVAPPSTLKAHGDHPGGSYRWRLEEGRTEPLPGDLADLPAAWVELMSAKRQPVSGDASDRYIAAAYRDELRSVETAPEGARNDTLNRAAFALARFVVQGRIREADLIADLVTVANASGLAEDEARRTISSALTSRRGAA
jgi:hypothetical protein